MDLAFRKFQREYYNEYASWFADAELNRQLGPMDDEWLEAVLNQPQTEGMTWAVFRGAELIAVVEISIDARQQLPIGINAIAVKPSLRKQGIGTDVLRKLLALYQTKSATGFVAYIAEDNLAAQHYVKKNGFKRMTSLPDAHGYVEFRYLPSE